MYLLILVHLLPLSLAIRFYLLPFHSFQAAFQGFSIRYQMGHAIRQGIIPWKIQQWYTASFRPTDIILRTHYSLIQRLSVTIFLENCIICLLRRTVYHRSYIQILCKPALVANFNRPIGLVVTTIQKIGTAKKICGKTRPGSHKQYQHCLLRKLSDNML